MMYNTEKTSSSHIGAVYMNHCRYEMEVPTYSRSSSMVRMFPMAAVSTATPLILIPKAVPIYNNLLKLESVLTSVYLMMLSSTGTIREDLTAVAGIKNA